MKAKKIVLWLAFVFVVATAAMIYGGQRCAIYPSGTLNWQANVPQECIPWSGCAQANQDGRCVGIFRIEIGDLTYAYHILSCNNATAGSINKCVDHPEVKCLPDGKLACLTFTAWSYADCSGESGTMTITTPKCKNQL